MTALNKEWTESDLSGQMTYTELVYPLSSVVDTATITELAPGPPAAESWVFESSNGAADAPKTFTVEQGDGVVRSHKFVNGIVTSFGMSFSRDGTELSGSMLGKALQDNITLTASPTAIELVPVLPTQVSVFLDPTSAALGTTKLTRFVSAEWRLNDRFGPLWVLDAAQSSFVTHLETEPTCEVEVMVEADAQGMALLDHLRTGATQYLRILAEGATITGAHKYKLQIDTAIKVNAVGNFSDEDGLYAISFTATAAFDPAWATGRAFLITVVNKQTAL